MKRVEIARKVEVAYCAPNLQVLNVLTEAGFSVSLPELDVEKGEEWGEA